MPIVNGNLQGPPNSRRSTNESCNTITLNSNSAYHTFTLNNDISMSDLNDLFPTSTCSWDLNMPSNEERPSWDGPESRQSLTPAQSPLNPYSQATQPSPATNPPTTPFSNSFVFSPLPVLDEPKEQKEPLESASENGESARLRNLLTNKRSSTDSEDSQAAGRNKDRILKKLLDQEKEEGSENISVKIEEGMSGLVRRHSMGTPHTTPTHPPPDTPPAQQNKPSSGNNNMLLQVSTSSISLLYCL